MKTILSTADELGMHAVPGWGLAGHVPALGPELRELGFASSQRYGHAQCARRARSACRFPPLTAASAQVDKVAFPDKVGLTQRGLAKLPLQERSRVVRPCSAPGHVQAKGSGLCSR